MKHPKAVTAVVTVVSVMVLGCLLGLLFMYSGLYDVSANKPHTALTQWVLEETMDGSVRRHAAAVKVPEDFAQMDLTEGIDHYQEMCVTCHGAPGIDRGEIGQGLNPLPPDLQESAAEMTPAELHWVIRNGVKMTGMPAFESTHTDEQLWAITALVHRFAQMTADDYQSLVEAAGAEVAPSDHEHAHDEG